jgi:hypothetical protein
MNIMVLVPFLIPSFVKLNVSNAQQYTFSLNVVQIKACHKWIEGLAIHEAISHSLPIMAD